MGCFTTIFLLAGFVLVVVSIIRWFEQTADAVDARAWKRVATLLLMPFSVWAYPSRVAAGRPSAFPLHEPVRGFGGLGKVKIGNDSNDSAKKGPAEAGPPPGTPKEFLAAPKVTVAKARKGHDPELMEKLKKKMRDQGMLPPE